MKDILGKLFGDNGQTTIYATTNKRLSPGRYEFIDDSGRIIRADTDLIISPTQRVIIQNGRVVSLSGINEKIRTYEV